jgi:hypothetical protein
MQGAEVTNTLAVLRRLHDKVEVDRNTFIALSSLAGRRGRLVGFVEFGFEANRAVIDIGGDRQVEYANSVLVHVANRERIDVPEALMPHNTEGLTSQVFYLPSDIFIRVIEHGQLEKYMSCRLRSRYKAVATRAVRSEHQRVQQKQ